MGSVIVETLSTKRGEKRITKEKVTDNKTSNIRVFLVLKGKVLIYRLN
jgi:hypothetical protein